MSDSVDDPAEIVLDGIRFELQPQCWQNMVLEILSSTENPPTVGGLLTRIERKLAEYKLLHHRHTDAADGVGRVRGRRGDLTVWMLVYA